MLQPNQSPTRWQRVRRLLLGLLLLILLAVAGFVIWALWTPTPMPEALAALASDPAVQVNIDDWLVFQPAAGSATTGFIFYPGGRVDARAYAPAAHAIAATGVLVVIVPMPLNLAVFAPNRADQVITAYPAIQRWAIGGHSLGGAMAATYV
ncbi:MAG: alpha/beta hydrolase, partial [Chloroflexota bacterium]|nr:alpha/beta hydrolase [Chloroflexota bacterium]